MKNIKDIMIFEERKRAFWSATLLVTIAAISLMIWLVNASLAAWSLDKVITAVDVFIALFLNGILCGMIWYWCVRGCLKLYKVKLRRKH